MTWNPNNENESLRGSWERHEAAELDSYMIADVEDPRIHCQSILTRALIADSIWPGEFTDLIDAEQRFGLVMTWILQQFKSGTAPADLYEAVVQRDCPAFVTETHYWLPQQETVRDYITLSLQNHEAKLPDIALETFSDLWRGALADRQVDPPLKILEAACGSANDYRFVHEFGFAPFIDYTGFDISPKNIDNARRRFASEARADFFVGSAFGTDLPDAAFDFVYTHDLFEHLSPDGIEAAFKELLRVTGKQAWFHFFNLSTSAGEHDIVPVDAYHWNLLSLEKLKSLIPDGFAAVEVIDIPEYMNAQFACPDYYNREAVTLLITRD
ncbi:MAG: SAM-dependent methyltransferase [Verrucomicrobiales bacterium]|jgi:SAM-dependent methyltransferase